MSDIEWTETERLIVARAIATATWDRHRLPASSPCKHCLDAHKAAEAALGAPVVEARVQQAKAEAWEVGVTKALNNAVRDDNGITLTLHAVNPYEGGDR